ncbi:putative cyanamide hydratase, partial [Aureobasidium namibiae CBS 147.97]
TSLSCDPAQRSSVEKKNKTPIPQLYSAISLPDTLLVQAVMEHVKQELPEHTFNHSMRVVYHGEMEFFSHRRMAIASQRFPDWKFSAETWLLTCLFHNIDTVNKQTRGTLMSFEFYGGYLAMAQLQKLNSPATQAEIVAEALIRHQDTVETGNITTIGLLTQLTTQFNNMGCHADYIHLDTIKDVVKNYLRREWSVCFSTKIREEVSIKPWCQTTASTPRFPQVVQHSELMAPYDNRY